MKAKRQIVIVSFLILISSTLLLGATKDLLWSALTFSDTPETIESARNMGISNPILLEEVLFIRDIDKDNVVGRENAYLLLQYCSFHQIISKDKFFNVAFDLLSQIDTIVFPNRVNIEKKKFTTLLSNYGLDFKTGYYIFSIADAFSSLISQLDGMALKGLISNQGVLNSLKVKIESAKQLIEKGNKDSVKAAVNKINAAINEAEAQKGNHITSEAVTIFTTFCQNLIHQLEK